MIVALPGLFSYLFFKWLNQQGRVEVEMVSYMYSSYTAARRKKSAVLISAE